MAQTDADTIEVTVQIGPIHKDRVVSRRHVDRPMGGRSYRQTEPAVREKWEETGSVVVTINVREIARRLGNRAMHNETGRATMMQGIIKARAIGNRDVQHFVRYDVPVEPGSVVVEAEKQAGV